MRATLVISTLCMVVTCAEVRRLATMCSAMRMRMVLIGSMRVLACPAAGGGGGAACSERGGGGGGAASARGGGGGGEGRRRGLLRRGRRRRRRGFDRRWRRRWRGRLLLARDVAFQILLRDAAARAGALHFAQVDGIFPRHAAHQRGEWTGGLGGFGGLFSGRRRGADVDVGRRTGVLPHGLGSSRLGSSRLGSSRLGSGRLGSSRLGSSRLGSGRLGSSRLGSGR